MSATGILDAAHVVFYHPLDNFTERTQGQAWSGTAGFTTGKVGQGASAVTTDAVGLGALHDANVSNACPMACQRLDSTRALCICQNASHVATVSGDDVTFGPNGGGSIGTQDVSTDLLDWDGTTGHVVLFRWYYGYTELYTITAGTTIARYSAWWLGGGTRTYFGAVAALDATRFVIASTASGATSFVVCTRSGASFSFGPSNNFPSAVAIGAMSALDSSRVLFLYRSWGGTDGSACVATVSGTDVTFGAPAPTTAQMALDEDNHETAAAVRISSSAALLLWTYGSRGYAKVATVSGAGATLGAQATFEPDAGITRLTRLGASPMGGGRVCASYAHALDTANEGWVVSGLVSGSSVSFGGRTAVGTLSYGTYTHSAGLSDSKCLVCFSWEWHNYCGAKVGQLGMETSMMAPTPGAYPAATGKDRLAVALWAKRLTASATVRVRRDYEILLTETSVTLGPASAVWSGAGIASLMSTMNAKVGDDYPARLLVLDFEHTGSGNWSLRTSIDGAAWTDQGGQDSGSRTTSPASAAPAFGATLPAEAAGQWYDELVLWAGDKTQFQRFTAEELANLRDLADVFGDPMDQYEDNYGAPLCWQATARMPDGTVWRDSGCGTCPPVVRVPRGASDIVVTDDGAPVRPRVQEG